MMICLRRAAVFALVMAFGGVPAFAAGTSNSWITVQTIKGYPVQILPATATAAVTIATGGAADGTIIKGVIASNTDTGSAYTVQLNYKSGATSYVMCSVNVPISSGNIAGTAPVNMISSTNCPGLPVDAQGNPYITIAAADLLTANVTVTVAANKVVGVIGFGGDY